MLGGRSRCSSESWPSMPPGSHLRRAAHSGAAHSRRVVRERAALLPQAGGAPDASGRSSRLSPSAFCHDPARSRASDPARPIAPDLLQRTFIAVAAQSRVGRRPHVCAPRQGFLKAPLLAIVLDACSAPHRGLVHGKPLARGAVLAALDMALQHRRPAAGVIHHSDHGPWQPIHGSRVPAAVSPRAGIRSSMGSVGDGYDNAMAESSSPPWSASCSAAPRSLRMPRPARRSLTSSRSSPTASGGTPRSATSPQRALKGGSHETPVVA